ncbi:MAG: ImmA/IrrE family metallo-endopeptidase [Bacillota bacterium]
MQALYRIIEEQAIKLDYSNLRQFGGILGLFVVHPRIGPFILLDDSLIKQPRKHRCVLAEEIGHAMHPPRPGHMRFHRRRYDVADNQAIIVAQDERKALLWATGFLMPDVEFWRAVSQGYDTVPDLAEYFYVEEWFVRTKIGFIDTQAHFFSRDAYRSGISGSMTASRF